MFLQLLGALLAFDFIKNSKTLIWNCPACDYENLDKEKVIQHTNNSHAKEYSVEIIDDLPTGKKKFIRYVDGEIIKTYWQRK